MDQAGGLLFLTLFRGRALDDLKTEGKALQRLRPTEFICITG